MKMLKSLAVLVVAAMLTACTTSLHPLFTEKELVFEPALLGKWVLNDEDGDRTEWVFTRGSGEAYGLVYIEDGDPGRFEARLLKLGRHLFLDIYPEEPTVDNGFYKLHLVRAHTFARITLAEDMLSISLMDEQWLEKGIESRELTIGHERLNGGGILLTAPTPELQQFILKVAEKPEAFSEASSFWRSE